MESFLIHWGYAAVFLFGFLEACCVPIPSEITFGFAGVLAGEGHLNIVAVIVVGTIAELLGSYVAYGIGRAGERPLVQRYGRYLLITQADIDRAERFIAGRGIWAIPLGRALPVVRTFVSIVAGFLKVPPLLFGVLSLHRHRRLGDRDLADRVRRRQRLAERRTRARPRRIRDSRAGDHRRRRVHHLPGA